MQWFRMYNETIYDRKLRRLPPAQRWLWIAVLAISRQSPEPGKLLLSADNPVTIDDLVDAAAISASDVAAGLEAFEQASMMHCEDGVWIVTNWNARQRESDDVKQRVRAYRERNRNVTGNVTSNESVTRQKQKQKQIQNKENSEGSEQEKRRASSAPSARSLSSEQSSDTPVDEIAETPAAAPAVSAEKTPPPARITREPNPIWDALVAQFYTPKTSPERAMFGKVAKELVAAGATADEIKRRCENHAIMQRTGVMPWKLTPNALVSHWSELDVVSIAPQVARAAQSSYAPPKRSASSYRTVMANEQL